MSDFKDLSREIDCSLCEEFRQDLGGAFLKKKGVFDDTFSSRVLFRRNGLILIPSLGPISFGHCMICPEEHFSSYAKLPKEKYPVEVITDVIGHVEEVISSQTGWPCILFEHGGRFLSGCGGCIDHAHLHIVPVSVDVEARLNQYFDRWVKLKNKYDFYSLRGSSHYLYYRNSGGDQKVLINPDNFPRQYFRQLIALYLNPRMDWNWRSNPNPNLVREIYTKLCGKF